MTEYWINFVYDMNPGRMSTFALHFWILFHSKFLCFSADWPRYDESSRYVMQLMRDNITLILDGKLFSSMSYLAIELYRWVVVQTLASLGRTTSIHLPSLPLLRNDQPHGFAVLPLCFALL